MRNIIIAGFVIALASGLFLNYAGHPWQVFAQTNSTSNATQSSTGASNATSQQQGASGGGGAAGGGGNATTTPSSTVSTVKGGPTRAGSASQLQQLTGPNASQIISSNTPIGNKPGLQGVTAEGTTTSQKNATSSASGGSSGQNASSAAGSAANKTSAGASSAGQNASSAAGSAANKTAGGGQAQNNTNPLSKIPVIGKLFGGQ
jgi:hypothetical protein